MLVRHSKTICVASIALFASLVALGNLTDYQSNFAFVSHVLRMDTVFPDSTLRSRAIEAQWLHHLAYWVIIALELLVAVCCWLGAIRMWQARAASARHFRHAKRAAIVGLLSGFLLWQVGFMTIGGEWFGMWMSSQWNGLASAFRFVVTILLVMILLLLPEAELDSHTPPA
jgi:predicted small integral membrane protein